MEETVSVTAESPLLETRSGSAGQVIGEKQISLMPLSDGNPFALARLVPGVAYNGDLKFSRPFDNGGTSAINADGSTGGNEFTLDGSPNMANGRRVAFVPPAGAVQEFKVSTASFDAAEGHTAGAMVNVTLKSGTNRIKGEAYEYMRRDRFVVDRLLRQEGRQPKAEGRPTIARGSRSAGRWCPGLYNGHDKTFFFGAVEWLYDEFPEPGPRTVPIAEDAQRRLLRAARAGTSASTTRPRAQKVGARVVRHAVPREHHSGQPDQPDRAAVDEVLSRAEPGRQRRARTTTSRPIRGPTRSTRSPRVSITDHRQAARVRALHAQQPTRVARRVIRRR